MSPDSRSTPDGVFYQRIDEGLTFDAAMEPFRRGPVMIPGVSHLDCFREGQEDGDHRFCLWQPFFGQQKMFPDGLRPLQGQEQLVLRGTEGQLWRVKDPHTGQVF